MLFFDARKQMLDALHIVYRTEARNILRIEVPIRIYRVYHTYICCIYLMSASSGGGQPLLAGGLHVALIFVRGGVHAGFLGFVEREILPALA